MLFFILPNKEKYVPRPNQIGQNAVQRYSVQFLMQQMQHTRDFFDTGNSALWHHRCVAFRSSVEQLLSFEAEVLN